jgi:hypothetical protein
MRIEYSGMGRAVKNQFTGYMWNQLYNEGNRGLPGNALCQRLPIHQKMQKRYEKILIKDLTKIS